MKNKILLIVPVLIVVVLLAGCVGSGNPTPTLTTVVSPTPVTSASPTASPMPTSGSQLVTVLPYPTTYKVDAQMTSQVSIVIGHWVESNYGWDNASLLRDVNFQHKDGDAYIYTFTVNGAPHTAKISYSDGKFILLDVDNGLVV